MILPLAGVGDSIFLILPCRGPHEQTMFVASFNSFVVDYCVRQKLGGINLNYFTIRQIPILPPYVTETPTSWLPSGVSLRQWIAPRVLELTYTAWDLEAFAGDLDYAGPPFRWDPERRFLVRCELDAAFFHLYGLERDDVDYVMDTFPIVRRRDEQAHGEYCTKRVILEIYDDLAEAIATGRPYQTRLDPPPADPRVAHSDASGKENRGRRP